MDKTELQQRVAARLVELGIGAVEAATSVDGLERNYIRDLLDGKKRSFSQSKVPLVAAALQWTPEQLTSGPRPQIRRPHDHGGSVRVTMVPLLDNVTAGQLKAPMSQIPVESVPLLAFADLGRGDYFALRVDEEADSMNRLSPPGSILVVNKADRELRTGRCYIFALNGETTYKMWQAGKPSYLAPYSTNPMHKPIFIQRKRDLEVIGRVKRSVLDL